MGTSRWFNLLGPLVEVINNGGVLVIDELESSLHTDMVLYFLKTFLANSDRAQLIFTSHDLMLMDLEYMRRDEIWFTEKKKDGSTDLFSLAEFKQRKDKNILNGYLAGVYGAKPLLREFYK